MELRSWAPASAPAGSSLAPSEPVSAGPQHLGSEVSDQGGPGRASSSRSCSVPGVPDGWPSRGAQELGVRKRQDTPTPDPLRLSREALGTGSQLSLHALCGWGLNLSRPAGAHGRRQALPHSGTAVAGSASGQGGAGQGPFCFLFLPMPLLETGHGLPRGDMKEGGTQ